MAFGRNDEVTACMRQAAEPYDAGFSGDGVIGPVAIDGTRTITPHEASTLERFPRPHLQDGSFAHHPQALVVLAFELFSRLPVGVAVLGHKASEHLGLRELLSSLGRNNLLILDRGYVGKALLRDLIASGN